MENDHEIAVLNLSKRLKPEDVLTMVDACNRQAATDLCPAWGVPYRPVTLYSDISQLPPGSTDIIPIMDEPGDSGALGFHSMGIAPFGRIFVNPVLDDDGVVLGDALDPQRLSVASVLSHEICELTVDPGCDQYAVDAAGNEYDLEVGDPVQRDQYLKTAKMPWGEVQVAVSDFALPSWFRVGAKGPYSFLDGPRAPFVISPGGYAQVNGQAVFARRSDGRAIYPPAWALATRAPGMRRHVGFGYAPNNKRFV